MELIEYNIGNTTEITALFCIVCGYEWEHNNIYISIHSVIEFRVSTHLLSHIVSLQGPHGWSFLYFNHRGKWKTALWFDYWAGNISEFQSIWKLCVQYLCHSKTLLPCRQEWELSGNCTIRKHSEGNNMWPTACYHICFSALRWLMHYCSEVRRPWS